MDYQLRTQENFEPLVFLCYRHEDGRQIAKAFFELLDGEQLSEATKLKVYFANASPAVDDWKRIHLPSLKKATMMIVIASPGLCVDEGKNDWVQMELDWWLANRNASPIVVDPSCVGRWIPAKILKRWPNLQRVNAKILDGQLEDREGCGACGR